MAFEIDLIVHPDSREMAESLECPVCHSLLQDPVQTRACQHVFCKGCVEGSKQCPYCRTKLTGDGLQPLSECNQFAMRMLHRLKVRCPYHHCISKSDLMQASVATTPSTDTGDETDTSEAAFSEGAQPAAGDSPKGSSNSESTTLESSSSRSRPSKSGEQAHCDWTGCYGDLLEKHLRLCPFHVIPCPHGCGQEMRQQNLAKHELLCEKNWVSCDICSKKVRPYDLATHIREDAEQHVRLLQKELQQERDQHKQTQRSLNAVSQSQQGFSSEVVWKIPDIAEALSKNPKGSSMKSSSFDLGNISEFHLQLCPNGASNSAPERFALYLHGPAGHRLKYTLTAAGVIQTYTQDFDGNSKAWGSHSFGKLQSQTGPFEIKVKLLEAVRLI